MMSWRACSQSLLVLGPATDYSNKRVFSHGRRSFTEAKRNNAGQGTAKPLVPGLHPYPNSTNGRIVSNEAVIAPLTPSSGCGTSQQTSASSADGRVLSSSFQRISAANEPWHTPLISPSCNRTDDGVIP